MYKELRPEQVDILVGNPAVNDEFSKKTRELDRRLQMNGMQYRDWDTLNDRQHDVFTDNLFLDGECASSIDGYVRGAVNSCGCPDTEEELHHHSPVLMREIEKQQEMLPDMKVKIGESLNFLNEMIDEGLESLMPQLLLLEASDKVEKYEQRVYDACTAAGIIGSWSAAQQGASPDKTGPDVSFKLPGLPEAFVEVKLNMQAGMGEGSARYKPDKGGGEFEISDGIMVKSGDKDDEGNDIMVPKKPPMEPELKQFIIGQLKSNEDNIRAFVKALRDPLDHRSYKWDTSLGGDSNKTALPFHTTYRAYNAAKEKGLYAKASSWPNGKDETPLPDYFIHALYARKGVDADKQGRWGKIDSTNYIQIGSDKTSQGGLYFLKDNPLGIPNLTQLPKEAVVVIRPKPSARKKVATNKEISGSITAVLNSQGIEAPTKDQITDYYNKHLNDDTIDFEPKLGWREDASYGPVRIGDYVFKGSEVQAKLRKMDRLLKTDAKFAATPEGKQGQEILNRIESEIITLPRDESDGIPEAIVYNTYGGTMMVQAKFPLAKSKQNPEGFELPPTPYTMDEAEGPRGIKAMLKAMGLQQAQQEPEESEED